MKNYRIEAIILAIGTLMLGVFIYWGLSAFAAKTAWWTCADWQSAR